MHSSWLVRALQEESPAVQRLVAASVPESLAHSIQAGLLLDSQDLVTERPVQPMFREWVMGLWTERLVGAQAARDDDPPALVAICGLSARAGYRLCRMAGLAKTILAAEKPGERTRSRISREPVIGMNGFAGRLDWRSDFSGIPRLRARADVQSASNQAAAAPSCRADRAVHVGEAAGRFRAVPPAVGARALAILDRQAHPFAHVRPIEQGAGHSSRRGSGLEIGMGTAHAGRTADRPLARSKRRRRGSITVSRDALILNP